MSFWMRRMMRRPTKIVINQSKSTGWLNRSKNTSSMCLHRNHDHTCTINTGFTTITSAHIQILLNLLRHCSPKWQDQVTAREITRFWMTPVRKNKINLATQNQESDQNVNKLTLALPKILAWVKNQIKNVNKMTLVLRKNLSASSFLIRF